MPELMANITGPVFYCGYFVSAYFFTDKTTNIQGFQKNHISAVWTKPVNPGRNTLSYITSMFWKGRRLDYLWPFM